MKILFQIFILLAVSNVCFCICVDMCKAEKFSKEKCKEFCDCLNETGYDEKRKDICANEVGATFDMTLDRISPTISSKASTMTTNTVQYSRGMLSSTAPCIPMTILMYNLFMYF